MTKNQTDRYFACPHPGNAGRLGTFVDELEHQQTGTEEEPTGCARRPELVRQQQQTTA